MASKRYKELRKKVDSTKKYGFDEAFELLSGMGGTKYDQSVDVAIRLGVDAKQSDQQVRGAVTLPHGLGKKITVLAFAKGEKEKEAREAGADYVGSDELIQKINEGWTEFDQVVATPDMMVAVSKVGKILGPRGLMPNPKTGTVTFDVGRAVRECKAGKAEFKTEKAGIVHCAIGKISFGAGKLKDNFNSLLETVTKLKPSSSKGIYIKGIAISGTATPSLRLDVSAFN